MKNNLYILLFIISFISFSCEKDLELAPEETITEATFFKAEVDFRLFASDFYNYLPRPSSSDVNTDIGFKLGGSSIAKGTHQIPVDDGTWNNSYVQIRATSILLEKAEVLKEENSTEYEKIKQFQGEAHFFRARAYFELFRLFGGVPVITNSLGIKDEKLYAPRNTREETFAQIIKDLDAAIGFLSENNTGLNQGRIDVYGAHAFKARVSLFEGTWRKYHSLGGHESLLDAAITSSNAVLSTDKFELFDKRTELGKQSYRYFFLLDGEGKTNPKTIDKSQNKETILAVVYDKEQRPSEWFQPVADLRQMNPTKILMDKFLCTDGLPIDQSPLFGSYDSLTTEYKNRDPRLTEMFYIPKERYYHFQQADWQRTFTDADTAKGFIYMDVPGDFGGSGRSITGYNGSKFTQEVKGPTGSDYPYIRLAEVMLIFAEATFEKNGSISNEDLNKSINKLRARVGMPVLTNEFVTANSLDMKEEIRRERVVELCFEGFRYDDIRRWKIAETVLLEDVKGIKYTGTQWETFAPKAGVEVDGDGFVVLEKGHVFNPKKHYLLPLPSTQRVLNPQLDQNPEW
jgi:hypothetical protein